MPTYTLERTSTHVLKPDRDSVSLPGGDDYRINVLSGKAHVSFVDGEIQPINKHGLTIDHSKKGDHTILSSTNAAVHVWRGVLDHPNSGVSRTPFPGQVEHPLERQDDPEPPGPPAVLKTKSPGGDPDVVSPADTKQQPQSTSRRRKDAANPQVKDLPEVERVPSKAKKRAPAKKKPAPRKSKPRARVTTKSKPKPKPKKRSKR